MKNFAATITLALCIGANTAVFSIVNTILIRPLPYPDSDRIYWVDEHFGPARNASVAPDYYSLREENRVFEEVAAYDPLTQNWSSGDKPEQLDAAQVSASFFRVMGARPMLGRYLSQEEEGSKAPPVAVVSYAFWRNRLGSDPAAIGKTITLDRLSNTIIGVMPQGFDYPKGTQIWRPWPSDESSQRVRSASRPIRIENIVARRKPQVTDRELATEMSRLTEAIRAEYPPEFHSGDFLQGMQLTAEPLQRLLTGDLRPALAVLSGAVGLVLLIACVNLANLMLARAATRQRELAVRLALGSTRLRIAGQMFRESLILALPGGLAGIAMAWLAVALLNAAKPAVLVRYPAIALDLRVLLFTFALTLLTGLIFGVAPAFVAARTNILETLKSSGTAHTAGPSSARMRRVLVVAELGVSLMLLIGAGLFARSFVRLAKTETGFPTDHLLTMRVRLAGAPYATGEKQARFYDEVMERLEQLPMVRSAAATYRIPMGAQFPSGARFQVAGRTPLPLAQQPDADTNLVSRDFFRTLGIPLKSGRLFDSQDRPGSPDTIVVNEAFARKIFPGEDPASQTLVMTGRQVQHWTIAGVVGDIRGQELGADPGPLMYRCTCQGGSTPLMGLVVRTSGDPAVAIAAVEGQVYAVDRDQPVFDVKTMDQRLDESLSPQRFQLALIGTFAALAMVMAAAGVYGVMSYLVTRRTREMGIRMALGARPRDVARLVVGESLELAVMAIGAGLIGAAALMKYVQSVLYRTPAVDLFTFAGTSALLLAIVFMAAWGPAVRAARVEPVRALKEE